MWDYVGIVRRTDRLRLALQRLELLKKEVDSYFEAGNAGDGVVELRNIVQTSILVIECALCRKESRGLHYNLDFPKTLDAEAHDTILDPLSWTGM